MTKATPLYLAGRKMRLMVREPAKAFFVCYPVSDLEACEATVKRNG